MVQALRALILEDRPADAELLIFELRRAGYAPDWRRVETETDYLAHLEPTLDIILADYALPQFDAVRALRLLQEKGWDIPFIIVTGTIGEEAAVECMKLGASDYLLKDRLARLSTAVEHALDQRRLRDAKRQAEEQFRRRNEELSTLNQTGQALGRLAEPSQILELIFKVIGQVVDNSNLYIALYDPANQSISFPIYTIYGQRQNVPGRRLGNGITEYVIRTQAPLLIPNQAQETIAQLGIASIGAPAACLLAVPMIVAEQVIGVITVQDYHNENVFDASHLDLLSTFAAQAAIALENARLLEETRRRARELAVLNQAGQLMASTLDLNTLLDQLLEQIKNLLDAECASVLLCAPTEQGLANELILAAVTGPAASKLLNRRMSVTTGIAGWVIREGRSALVLDAQNDPRLEKNIDLEIGVTTRSLLAVPLTFKSAVLGVIEAVNKKPGSAQAAFDEHDLYLLEALSNSASIAIQNARLFTSEQQRAADLARALEQQREADRLQHELIQNVSHELRTPLALIRGHAEILESGWLGQLTSEQQNSISVITRRSQMLSKLVDSIVAVLELEERELLRESVDLAQLVHLAWTDFQAAAQQSGLALIAEIAPDLSPVWGDMMTLRRVLDNLMSNAFKFTPAGGRVTVRLSGRGQAVELQVADTGVGIPADKLNRIFERFYQVDGTASRKYGGMGLGLTLVKEIVRLHGGEIAVTSQEGVGTTFTILLPVEATVN